MKRESIELRELLRSRRYLGLRVWMAGFCTMGMAFVVFALASEAFGAVVGFMGFGLAAMGMVLHVAWIYQHRKPH